MSGLRLLAVGILCVWITGCSDDPNRRPTAPVKVTVTYKGKAVEGAIVQFIATDNPQPSVGTTDASGACSLYTYKPNDGAIVGVNSVTITKNEIDNKNVRPVDPADADLIGVTPTPILKSMIPKKYSSPTTSGLQADVVKGGNTFNYDLVD